MAQGPLLLSSYGGREDPVDRQKGCVTAGPDLLGPVVIGVPSVVRLLSGLVDERYGLMLVPSHECSPSVSDLVAQRQRDGWQLVSSRVDNEGAEVMVFRRPA